MAMGFCTSGSAANTVALNPGGSFIFAADSPAGMESVSAGLRGTSYPATLRVVASVLSLQPCKGCIDSLYLAGPHNPVEFTGSFNVQALSAPELRVHYDENLKRICPPTN